MKLISAILGILVIAGCSPVPSISAPGAAPTSLPSAERGEPQVPPGWATYTGEVCKYEVSYPSEMQVTHQNAYGQLINFPVVDRESDARHFIFVSVIAPEIEAKVAAGTYLADVYNYDPAATETLLSMQVGEIGSSHQGMASGFTYQRLPDTQLGGLTAQAYENAQPWEFPPGSKEIRYYASVDGCTYLIGGYVDTAGSDQPGAITEDLFQQIMATIRLIQ